MKIEHVIYSSHLTTESISDDALRAASAKYAEVSRETLAAAYPDAEIEVTVEHTVSGVGAGIRVYDEDGMENEVESAAAKAAVERASEHRTAEIWA